MAIAPQTNIRLLKVPFELDNNNQLTFSNINSQTNYFLSLPYLLIDNCSYQRHDNYINFPTHLDSIITYNYVMYQNDNYSDKYFYAFITNMEYINDNLTRIYIETDTFQTWQFNIEYHKMFIEREHVSDDTIGLHTIPENINSGDITCDYLTEDVSLSEYAWVAIASSWNPSTEKQFDGITVYNKQVFGYELHVINANPISNLRNLLLYLYKTNSDGHINDIQDIFIIPDALITQSQLTEQTSSIGGQDFSFYILPFSDSPTTFNTTISKLTSFKNYTPKNNKCFVYPYNYLLVTNNIGNQNIYKYEQFNSTDVVFKNELSIGIGASGKIVPLNYQGMDRNDDEALPLAKYPTCGWSTDSYINWLTQNAINLPLQITDIVFTPISNALNALPNALTGNVSGSGSSGLDMTISQVSKVMNVYDSFRQAQLLPNIQGNSPVGDVNYSANRNTFTFKQMHSKPEYLKIIDDFFTMYGYKVNIVKLPELNTRPNWNYIKTINCNITGDIPQTDIQTLKNIFDRGVTLWHNPSTFLDYSQNNK